MNLNCYLAKLSKSFQHDEFMKTDLLSTLMSIQLTLTPKVGSY